MINMQFRILAFLSFSAAIAKNAQGAASPSPSPITSFDPSLLQKGKVYHFRPVSFGSDGPNLFLSGNSEDKSINFKYPSLAAFQSLSDPEAQASSRFPAATEPEETVADSAAEEAAEVKKFVKIIPASSSSVEGSSEESASGSIGAESQRREKRKKAKKSSSSEIPWDASYAFGYTFDDQSRHEVSDPDGNVNGYYQYIDDEGYVRKVVYTAGAGKGFVVLNKQRSKSPLGEITGGHKRPHKIPSSAPGRPHGGSHTPEYPEQEEEDDDEDSRSKSPMAEIIGGHKRPHKMPPGRPHGGSHTPEYPEREEGEDIGHRPSHPPPHPPPHPPSHPPSNHGRPVPRQFEHGPPADENHGYPGFEGPPRPPKKGRDKPIYVVKIRRPSSPRPKPHGTPPHRPSVSRPAPPGSETDDDEDDGSYKEEYNHHHEGSGEESYSGGGPKPDPSYSFGYETETANRLEKADNFGNVRGSYSYIDNDGIKRTVHYIAGANTGFQVLKTSPTKPHSVRIEAPSGFIVSKKRSSKPPPTVPIPLIAPAGLTTSEFRYLPSSQPSTIVYHIHPESSWRPWDIPGGSRPRNMRKVMRIRKKSKSSKSRPKGASSRTIEIAGGIPSERRFFKESSKTSPTTTVPIPKEQREEPPKTFRHSTRVTNPSETPFFVIPRSSLKRHASHRAYTDLHGPLEDDDTYFTVKGKSDDPILFSPSLESLTTAQDTRRPIPNPILLRSSSVQIRNLGSVGSLNAESGAGILAPVTETSESRPYPERQDLIQERSSDVRSDGLNDQRPVTISPTQSTSASFYSTQRDEDEGYEVTPPTFEETEDYTFSSTAQPHIQSDDQRDRGRGFMMSSNQFARAIQNNQARKVEVESERGQDVNVNYSPLMSSSARLMQRLGIERSN